MHSIELVLIMLLAVVASSYLVRAVPVPLPMPLVQITLGVLIAALSNSVVKLDSEIFLFIFLPPLLFLDGWRIPKAGLFHDKGIVIGLALGLVFFTVIGAGWIIHWLLPSMPLAVAFALAAVISPTDPVAVSSIVSRCPLPKRLMHILEGESLLNDATGLVCFRFAVVAAMTGAFSLQEASLSFLWLIAAGLALGVAVTLGINYAQHWLSRHWGEESAAAILVNLLTPFGAYLAAELVHASGILAAVAAGITMSYIELSGRALATTRIQRNAVWDMVRFTLNGLMFVLLGEQLPAIVRQGLLVTEGAEQHFNWWLPACALLIAVILAVLRYVWMWMSLRVLLLRASLAGHEVGKIDSRIVPVMSLAGVRGAVTLAGVLSLPLLHGSLPFPGRDQAIFLAAAVILISLLGASMLLPRLLRGKEMTVPDVSTEEREEEEAIREASGEAIKAVESASHDMATDNPGEAELYAQIAVRVMERYKYRLAPDEPYAVSDEHALRIADRVETKLRLVALQAERATFFRLAREKRISDEALRRLKEPIDLAEASVNKSDNK